jgi:organic radical activating enzyme
MADNWEEGSDDDWDVDDDDLDQRLGLKKDNEVPDFADEEDLAVKEREENEKNQHALLKKKGTALQQKKAAELERLEELEVARKAMELEAEAEANMSPEERKALKQRQIEEADHALTDDLFGAVEATTAAAKAGGQTATGGGPLVLKDAKDHLKHARAVATAMKKHGKIHFATSFIREVLEQSKTLLDDAAITDIIKTCNVIKNEKVQESKKKTKGQAQKSKKTDKTVVAKARQVQVDTFGDNDNYDDYDQVGQDYEDAFF